MIISQVHRSCICDVITNPVIVISIIKFLKQLIKSTITPKYYVTYHSGPHSHIHDTITQLHNHTNLEISQRWVILRNCVIVLNCVDAITTSCCVWIGLPLYFMEIEKREDKRFNFVGCNNSRCQLLIEYNIQALAILAITSSWKSH